MKTSKEGENGEKKRQKGGFEGARPKDGAKKGLRGAPFKKWAVWTTWIKGYFEVKVELKVVKGRL